MQTAIMQVMICKRTGQNTLALSLCHTTLRQPHGQPKLTRMNLFSADVIFGTDVVQQGDTSPIPADQYETDLKKRLQFHVNWHRKIYSIVRMNAKLNLMKQHGIQTLRLET